MEAKETKKPRRRRLPPEMRREMILEAAIAYFADHGFEVQIRHLASKIGISPALIFKYFETKEVLIDAVYEAVFESRWQEEWVTTLTDRSLPLSDRLVAFYRSYMATTDDRNWIRIAMRASLDNSAMTRRYLADHVSRILVLIADEIEAALPESSLSQRSMSTPELRIEYVWHLHSTVIYYLIRKHIHQVPVLEDPDELILLIVDQTISSGKEGTARRAK